MLRLNVNVGIKVKYIFRSGTSVLGPYLTVLFYQVPHLIVNTKFTPCSNFAQTDCEKRKKFGNGNTFAQQTPLLRLWILFPPSSEAYFGKYWRWKEDMPFSFFSSAAFAFHLSCNWTKKIVTSDQTQSKMSTFTEKLQPPGHSHTDTNHHDCAIPTSIYMKVHWLYFFALHLPRYD